MVHRTHCCGRRRVLDAAALRWWLTGVDAHTDLRRITVPEQPPETSIYRLHRQWRVWSAAGATGFLTSAKKQTEREQLHHLNKALQTAAVQHDTKTAVCSRSQPASALWLMSGAWDLMHAKLARKLKLPLTSHSANNKTVNTPCRCNRRTVQATYVYTPDEAMIVICHTEYFPAPSRSPVNRHDMDMPHLFSCTSVYDSL